MSPDDFLTPFHARSASDEERERAFERTRTVLWRLRDLCADLGLPLETINIAAKIYTDTLGSIVSSANREAFGTRQAKIAELMKLGAIDTREDPHGMGMYMEPLSDEEIEQRLEVARCRQNIGVVVEMSPTSASAVGAVLQGREDLGGNEP